MRFKLVGKAIATLSCLVLVAGQAEAGFRHHHRLRQGGCSDPCHTASAWGGVSYNSACGAAPAAGYGYAAGPGYASAACGPAYSVPSYSVPAYGVPGYSAPNYCAPYQGGAMLGSSTYGASCGPAIGMAAMSGAGMSSAVAGGIAQMATIDLGPMTMYKVVLEPQVTTETRLVSSVEYRDEPRTRSRVVQRTQPVQFEDYRTRTVMVPKTETKTIEYSVLVPHTSEKSVEVVESVPVWNEIEQSYTVKVPVLSDVQEEYVVRVPKLEDQEFSYTAYVPHAETQTRMQTVTNAVPVTKTRTVTVCVPVSRTQTVTKDYGHWETRMEEVTVQTSAGYGAGCGVPAVGYSSGPAYSPGYGMGGCSPCAATAVSGRHHCGLLGRLHHHGHRAACGSSGCGAANCGAANCGAGCGDAIVTGGYAGVGAGCGIGMGQVIQAAPTTQMVARQVWVPNVVTEEVSVVENVSKPQEISYTVYEQHSEQVPYEATVVTYRPEVRTGSRKVVNYVPETRTRTRKVVSYQDETRTRKLRQASYEQRTRTETIPVVTYTTEKRTKEVSYTVNVPDTQVETFTATRYETVEEVVTEEYTERVAIPVCKEVQVQVTRMVPKLVAYQVNLSLPASAVNPGSGCGPGYGAGSAGPMPAIMGGSCGSCGVISGAVNGGVVIGGCSQCGVSVGCPNCR